MGWSVVRPTGLTHHRKEYSIKGYTLITPLAGYATYLLDMQGHIVHEWKHNFILPLFAKLLPNGNLMVIGTHKSLSPPHQPSSERTSHSLGNHVRQLGGAASTLQELDWDGNLIWSYDNPFIHHDFCRLDNGNTLIPEWVALPDEISHKVKGGRKRPRKQIPPMLGDDIIEVDMTGNTISRWETWKLFDPRKDPICPLESRSEWTHLNSVDQQSNGDIVISCRINHRIAIIDRQSKQFIWKYGEGILGHQHHATALANGNVQVFDNGLHTHDLPTSRVIEINPRTNDIEWQYNAVPKTQFFSAHLSGVQRLAHGNVLICEGTGGRILEISHTGDPVWEWISPFLHEMPNYGVINWLYRAYRYNLDHPAFSDKCLEGQAYGNLNREYGLSK
tara:strand:+ start:29 stop:1198 length:1170 start_codon:yes stop_codon:yes gene_type:complete